MKSKNIGKFVSQQIAKKQELKKLNENRVDDDEEYIIVTEEEKIKQPFVEKSIQKPIDRLSRYGISNSRTVESKIKQKKVILEEPIVDVKNFRSPIICVLGHVDAGKTSMLDYLMNSSVQKMEFGGITQNISARFMSIKKIDKCLVNWSKNKKYTLNIPGLILIDTPGHETFTNMRQSGSSICDLAILVVDIFHGLKDQTIESIEILKDKNIPFIVALNKIDLIYGWKKGNDASFKDILKNQTKNVQMELTRLIKKIFVQFAENEINADFFLDIKDFNEWTALCPISSKTGQGISDFIMLIVQYTQRKLKNVITKNSRFQANIIEMSSLTGFGKTLDIILVGGDLCLTDKLMMCGLNGALETNIKCILIPKDDDYEKVEKIESSCYAKLVIKENSKDIIPGTIIMKMDDLNDYSKVTDKLEIIKNMIVADGLYCVTNTFGSLESLFNMLKKENVPIANFSIGSVKKVDVMKTSLMLEKDLKKYAVILSLGVKIKAEAIEEAKKMGIKIISSDVIYKLFDEYKKYVLELEDIERNDNIDDTIWPCALKIYPEFIFNNKNPIILGIKVLDGELRKNIPLIVVGPNLKIGIVNNIKINDNDVDKCIKGQDASISIVPINDVFMYGRHFTHENVLISELTRKSINSLKKYYPEDTLKYINLIKQIKVQLDII